NEVRIIRVTDEAIPEWSDELLARPGQVGEITVAGPSATDTYFKREGQTRLAKIREVGSSSASFPPSALRAPSPASGGSTREAGDGGNLAGEARIVHRMGDLGYFDAEGRLWFCGRKS